MLTGSNPVSVENARGCRVRTRSAHQSGTAASRSVSSFAPKNATAAAKKVSMSSTSQPTSSAPPPRLSRLALSLHALTSRPG